MSPRRVNPPLAVFGALCVALSALLLSGARDWHWLSRSYVAPTLLIGLGAVILAATLWPERGPRPVPAPGPWPDPGRDDRAAVPPDPALHPAEPSLASEPGRETTDG
jgi:hypothetical protein